MKREKLEGISGQISNIELSQLVQMVCLAGSNICITAVSNDKEGKIYVEAGNVVHAEAFDIEGEDALFEIAKWDNLYFKLGSERLAKKRTIDKPWEFLMIEATRLRDEETKAEKTRVLIVDDSTFFARKLEKSMENDDELQVVGVAADGSEALDFIERHQVDVVIMDIFMPVMSGDTALKHIMLKYRLPVMIVSAFPEDSFNRIFDFLRLGAVEIYPKPSGDNPSHGNYEEEIKNKIKRIRNARVDNFRVIRNIGRSGLSQRVNQHSQGMVVIVGAEGSYCEWFRLPLHLFQGKILLGCTLLHHEILPVFARLLEKQTDFPVTFSAGKDSEILSNGVVHLVNLNEARSVKGSVSGIELLRISSEAKSFSEKVLLLLMSIVENTDIQTDVIVLSAPERCSDEWRNVMENPALRLWVADPEILLCPELSESLIELRDKTNSCSFNVFSSWEMLRKYENCGCV